MAGQPAKTDGRNSPRAAERVMPLTISAISTIPHVPPPITMPPEPVARAQSATGTKPVQPSVASADASRSKQQAALTQMLVKYTYDQSHGMDPTTLSALGKQFTAAAKALGQHVSLPHAPPGVAASPIKVSVNA
jgi:hypothetical protein